MAIDTAPAPAPAPPTSRPRILRATLVAVTVVALLILVPTLVAWLWGPARSTDVWAARFGDANIRLATDLPADPGTVTTYAWENTTFGLPDDTSIFAAAFGGPVVKVEDGTWATATGTITSWDPHLGTDTSEPPAGFGIEFRGPDLEALPSAATFPTRVAQEAEVRRIADALGLPDDSRIAKPTSRSRYEVHQPPVAGAMQVEGVLLPAIPVIVFFADDGTLRDVLFTTTLPVDDPPTERPAVSPAQALDDLRHHRPNTYREPTWSPNLLDQVSGVHLFPNSQDLPRRPGPITSIVLVEDGPGVVNGHTNPVWEFRDAKGALVGDVIAVQGAEYVTDGSFSGR